MPEEKIIIPPKKPKSYKRTLDILNTQAAANTIAPKDYAYLVGDFARKAYDNEEISYDEYMEIVKPLFGKVGEMVSEKIEERENYKEGTTLEKLGDIVDVRNVPYYASKGLEGIVNAGEILSKFPFVAGNLISDLSREVPNKKMFLDALEDIQPGSFAEKIGLADLITRQEEKLSPETKTVGSQLSLGTETFVPVGAAFKLGEKIIKGASKKLGPIENNKSLEKIIDERLTDYGEGRRDFNKLVGTSGLLVALKSIGLGNIAKTTKAGDDFRVSLVQDFDGEYVDETMVGYENLYTTIEPLTKKGKEILKKLKLKSDEGVSGPKGDEVFINNGEDALIAIEKIKGQTDNIGLEIDVLKPKKEGELGYRGSEKKTFRMGDNPQDVFEEASELTVERGPFREFEYADEFTGDIVDTILNPRVAKQQGGIADLEEAMQFGYPSD
jgi:hypothetical protein